MGFFWIVELPRKLSVFFLMVSGIFMIFLQYYMLFIPTQIERFSIALFFFMGQKISRLDIPSNRERNSLVDVNPVEERNLFCLSLLSHLIIVIGFYLMIVLYILYTISLAGYDYAVDSFLTAAGTLLSVIYFDPRASSLIDKSKDPFSAATVIMRARLTSMSVIFLLSGLFLALLYV